MPSVELIGTITEIFPVEQYNNFQKRVFWLKQPDEEKFPQQWQLEVQQQQISLLDDYARGDEVSCTVNIRGKEWISKKGEKVVMNTLQCWKISKLSKGGRPKQVSSRMDEDESLPF